MFIQNIAFRDVMPILRLSFQHWISTEPWLYSRKVISFPLRNTLKVGIGWGIDSLNPFQSLHWSVV